ncbi:unnamed protein product [Allacma fusca]|uniref:MD-2-related lipid-recognition domain-containing protein n=1 Tax=Allacma fusca TaxID=39272 RepID=A0A8J2J1I1_9HEXA|nr:unnamed protein product [Allacma fusca]
MDGYSKKTASCSSAALLNKRILSKTEIHQVQGIIEPIDCKSVGAISRVAFTNCSSFPCDIVRSKTYSIDITLNPAQDHNSLELHISSIYAGIETSLYNANIPVAVTHGKSEILAYPWVVYGHIQPTQSVGVRVQLEADGVVEFCGIIPANIW